MRMTTTMEVLPSVWLEACFGNLTTFYCSLSFPFFFWFLLIESRAPWFRLVWILVALSTLFFSSPNHISQGIANWAHVQRIRVFDHQNSIEPIKMKHTRTKRSIVAAGDAQSSPRTPNKFDSSLKAIYQCGKVDNETLPLNNTWCKYQGIKSLE